MTPAAESLQTALRLHQAGDYAEAGRIYREILREHPDHADALQLLGLIEHQAGRHAAAVELIGRAIALTPGAAILHNNLGEALRTLGRLDEAVACYAKAIALDPAFADAHHNLGVVAGERGEADAAIAHYRQAVAVRPDHAAALNNLGHALAGKGELEEAEACLRRAIACRPGFAEVHNNLGTLLMGQSRQAEARREFEQALSCKPGFALALANLGALAQEEGRPEEALEYYRTAREAAPDMAGAWVSSGMVLAEQGRWREAREAFARALEIRPSDAVRILHGCVLPPIAESKAQMLEARRRYADCLRELSGGTVSIGDPVAEVNAVPFYLAYQGLNDRELQRSLARLYQRACPSLEYRAPHCDSPRLAVASGKIRIGFVSRVIGRQSVARVLMSGLISRLSREKFDVSVYSFPHGRNDDIAQMQTCAGRVVMLPPVLPAARERLAAERLDVLCHVDIGMEPLTYFLAFARLAPVQFASWLHPVTTGIRNVDYFLSSSLIEPERAEAHYSEQLVQLATLPTWYERPKTPAPLKPRAELGLNEAKTQYVCPQSPFKIHPDFDALLAAILRADPNGEVVLLEGRLREWARSLLARIRAGAPDVAARLRCIPTLPPADFEHLLASADVLLDPLHWSGGITTLDALAFGTPVVTLPSAMMRGRVTYGCYRMMGMMDCVAGSEREYVELAVRLGTSRESREATRAKILARNAVLYRNDGAVREFEQFVGEAVLGGPAATKSSSGRLAVSSASLADAKTHYLAGRYRELETLANDVLRSNPGHAEALHWLGVLALEAGRNEAAAELFGKALKGAPGNPNLHVNRGEALRRAGRTDEALQCYWKALALKPEFALAHFNVGTVLAERGDRDTAAVHFRRALAVQPDYAEAYSNLGSTLKDLGNLEEADQCFRRALALKPDFDAAHSNLIFTMDLLDRYDLQEQQAERRRWNEQHAQRYAKAIRPHDNVPDPDRRIRVGYVSADFRRQSACMAFGPVITHHDRANFEVVCYSGVVREDEVTARLRASAEGWRSTLGVSDDDLAEQIRQDRIDILVDLAGHMAGNRLLVFARKPAPVQVTAWGNGAGTGLATMDYLFADLVTIPPHERRHFSEEVIDLPCVICFEPAEYAPDVSPLPALEGRPVTFGCTNRPEKISDRVIGLWARILSALPGSSLLIKGSGLGSTSLRHQMLGRLEEAGIEAGRIRLIGGSAHPEHLRIFREIDVGLDPYPHGGGITTCEALYMGVPVATLAGATPPSRNGSRILSAMGMSEWIATSEEEYVGIAVRAASDLRSLATLRKGLRQRMVRSPLGDLDRYRRTVESVYRTIWRRWCAREG